MKSYVVWELLNKRSIDVIDVFITFSFRYLSFSLSHFFLDKWCGFHRCSTHTHAGVSGKCFSGLWRPLAGRPGRGHDAACAWLELSKLMRLQRDGDSNMELCEYT